jgi:phosphate transport system substrate-binding protein
MGVEKWTCDGVPKNDRPYPEQNPTGSHEPYENFGKTCAYCGLPQEAMEKEVASAGAGLPWKPIAATIAALGAIGLGYALFPKPCPAGEQKINNVCVAIAPSPDPTPSPSPSPSVTDSPAPTVSPTVSPTVAAAPTIAQYRSFTDVPNVPKLKVRYGGSTSFAVLRSEAIVRQIAAAHPGFELIYAEPPSGEKPGSGSGIRMLIEGQLSVAQSSRSLKDDEYSKAKDRKTSLEQQAVAIDGITLYVNPQVNVSSLTLAQVKDIFTGKITNWKQVGGSDLPIKPLSRDPNDGGTPEFFQEKVLQTQPFAASVQPYMRDTTTSLQQTARTPGGIGYATASEVCNQSTVKVLSVARESGSPVAPCNGQEVNRAVFANDTYPITRRLFVIIRRDGTLDEQAAVAYVNLLLSDEGQKLVDRAGLVPLRN